MNLPENIQAGLANINAKTEVNAEAKLADNIHNQFGGTTTVDNSHQQIIQKNFNIAILPNLNCSRAIIDALKIGNENANLVGGELINLLNQNNISEEQILSKLSNPEVLSTIAEANKISYTTNNVEKRKLLSDLIYQKITNDDDFKSIILTLAITTLSNLTETQLKILSLFFFLQSSYFKNLSVSNWEEFKEMYNFYIKPLLEYDTQTPELEFFNLYSTGCVVTSLLNIFNNEDYFYKTIRKFVSDQIPEEEVDPSLYQTLALYNTGFCKISDKNYYIVDKKPFDFYDALSKEQKITSEQKEALKNLYIKYGYDSNEFICQHMQFHDNYEKLINKVENYHFSFTPVGKQIAKNYIGLKLGINIQED